MNTQCTFARELEQLTNKHSIENGSNTPDFMLADYLMRCLRAYEIINNEREKWYGKINVPGQSNAVTVPTGTGDEK
jgi:hypothetical protein